MDFPPITRLRTLAVALSSLVLFASGDGVAAHGIASVGAVVVEPVTISTSAALSFGRFAPGTGGTVTVSTSGVRTNSGVRLSADDSSFAAAIVVVTGGHGASFGIRHGALAPLARNTGSETMTLTTFSDVKAANPTGGTAGTQSIAIGGTLKIASNQASGNYAGEVFVTVEYN